MAPEPGKPVLYDVLAKFFRVSKKGTENESVSVDPVWTINGPFGGREAADKFAAGLATQKLISQVKIKEHDDGKAKEV